MKIVYISDDGLSFDNEFDCKEHEFNLSMKAVQIKVFDKRRHRLTNIASDDTYNNSYRVIIANDKDLEDMKHIQSWTGYYCDIDSIGTWIYNENEERFIKKGGL